MEVNKNRVVKDKQIEAEIKSSSGDNSSKSTTFSVTPGNKINIFQDKNLNANNYSPSDKEPFIVYIYDTNKEDAMHPLQNCDIVIKIVPNNIIENKGIGCGKTMMTLQTAIAANNLLISTLLKTYGLKAFILHSVL